MAIQNRWNPKGGKPQSRPTILLLFSSIVLVALFFSFLTFSSNFPFDGGRSRDPAAAPIWSEKHYLYWGSRIDCPGKHCDSCEGLGHQESSLRCALEEAIFLDRVFVMPSRMCINPVHNSKEILHHSGNASSQERWAENSCPMDSLYDLDRMSETVHVILDNSKVWYRVLSMAMRLKGRGIAFSQGVSRADLRDNDRFSTALVINRTASPLSWFMECKDRNNRSQIALPYSFLPLMASKRLRDVADKIKSDLGEYDAIHVRRGDKIKTRKDRFGVARTLHPHLDRDTRPEFIQQRIEKWIPPGRTLFIASNERTPGFFSPLAARYKLAYSSNYSDIIDDVIENNYQLFMIERLILYGAKTFIKTFKEDEGDLSLTDDAKKNTKEWKIPVYTGDE